MIKVVDDFLSEELLEYVQWVTLNLKYTLHRSKWGDPTPKIFKSDGEFPEHDVFEYLAQQKIAKLDFINVKSFVRVYVNLYVQGEYGGGKFHYDDGDITALFYPFDWQDEYGGETEFENGELIRYKKNRIIFFNAKEMHRANAHINPNNYRYTIAFKMNATWN